MRNVERYIGNFFRDGSIEKGFAVVSDKSVYSA